MKNESISTKKIVMTAFFAAIIYLGIQSFRIPLPAAVGTPFLHFGHIFVMLAVLMLGPKLSTVAGVLGLLVFDVLNGYIQAIPNVFVSTIIKCLLVGMIFQSLKKIHFLCQLFIIFCTADALGDPALQNLNVRKDQFQIDRLDISCRIHTAVYMDDIGILKTAYDMHDGIHLTDVGKELIAQSFSL